MSERNTIQKSKIIEYIKNSREHPTAEKVYKAVKKQIPTITLATVYRNLNLMAEQGEISRFKANNEFRFDGMLCNHQHCICKKCGKILDNIQPEISKHAKQKFNSNTFLASEVNITYLGLCNQCK